VVNGWASVKTEQKYYQFLSQETTMILKSVVAMSLVGLLGWVGKNIWKKHGPKAAERYPIIERMGLAERPPKVIEGEANLSVSTRGRV
jgi:hypothetical protein